MPHRLAIDPGGHGDHSEVTVVDAGPGRGGPGVRRAALGLSWSLANVTTASVTKSAAALAV
jgi:hypothetical protein